jgi:DNA-binding MarR family transcriptional regulator
MEKDSLIGSIFAKTHWYLSAYFQKLIKEKKLNTTPEQYSILISLFLNPGLSQTQVSEKTMKDKTTITRILDVLEKNGYIERRNDPADRRAYKVFLTNAGEILYKESTKIVNIIDDECRNNLSKEDYANIINISNKLQNSIKKKNSI